MSKKKVVITVLSFGICLPVLLGLFTYFFLRPDAPKEYTTLTEIDKYVAGLEEFVKPDGEDYEDPYFLAHYKSRNPSLFGYALQKISLWKIPPSSPLYLAQLISEVTKRNHAAGLVDGKNNFIHIKAHNSKFFVFGDIHGALHSLVRDLKQLRSMGILSDDLKVKDPTSYVIFNGDLIDRASYSVDTLIIVAQLMKQNPDRVIYIAGRHERNAHWKDYSLKRELSNRARFYSAQKIPLYNELTAFFASLPAAVYISGQKDVNDMIRISFFDKNELSYNENRIDPTLLKRNEALKIYHSEDMPKSPSRIDIRAAIKTEDWRHDNRIHHGIGLLDQTNSATNWGILSSPTLAHKKFLDFHDDAFALVEVGTSIKEATIRAIHQERNSQSFSEEVALNMLSGRPAENQIPFKDIRIGSSISLIRGAPIVGKQLSYGINTRVREFNTDIKNHGKLIRLQIDNDDLVPRFALQNTERQLKEGIHYFLLPLGTETTLASTTVLHNQGAALFFPRTQASALRKPNYTSLIHLLASDEDEARVLTRVMKEDGAFKFAFFYQDDELGKAPFLAAVAELKKLGIKNILPLPYKQGSISFSDQADKLRRSPPDALGLFSTTKAAKELIRQVGVKELLATNIFALSSLGEIQFRRFFQHKGLSIRFSASVPNPFISNKAIAVAFREAMNRDNNIIDVFSFEAYVATSLFIDALEKTQNPTPKKLLSFFESIKNKDFKGVKLNFNKEKRSLATQVFVETTNSDEWREFTIEQR